MRARTLGPGGQGRAGGHGRARGARSAPGRAKKRRRSEPAPPCFHSRCGAAGRGGDGGGGGMEGGGRGRRAAGGEPASSPPSPRGASGAALAAAPLRAARNDLPAALAPSALSAWPGTCAQIAAAANLPAPPSPVAPSLPPSLSSAGPPPRAPAAATRPPVPARPSSPFTPEPALLARATDPSPGSSESCIPAAVRAPSARPRLPPPHPPNSDPLTTLCPVSGNCLRQSHIRLFWGSTFNRLKAWSHRFNGGMAGFCRLERRVPVLSRPQ